MKRSPRPTRSKTQRAAPNAAASFIKSEPIFALGFASMIVQGAVLSFVYANSRFRGPSALRAVLLAWLFGAFLVSYIGLAEAAKYAVPSVPSWIGVEFAVGAIQFTLAGLFLWLAHRAREQGYGEPAAWRAK